MANIKSAKKRIRQTAKRQATQQGRAVPPAHVAQGLPRGRRRPSRPRRSPRPTREIDVALKKGVIHKNAAARLQVPAREEGRREGVVESGVIR